MAADTATGAETSTQLGEIVVTAQYREEKLQDTPIAITALTSEMIEQQGATKLSDILNSAPSVAFRQQSAAFGESVTAFIRGFGQADFDPAFEPGVGLYIDDVYYPRLTGANFDLMDVERVEVLRGPQGTLEGRNSEGGAIRFVTKKPTGDEDGYAGITYGTRNRLEMRGWRYQTRRAPVREVRRRVRQSGRLRQRVQLRLRISSQRRSSTRRRHEVQTVFPRRRRLPRGALQPALQSVGPVRLTLQRRLHSRRSQQRRGSPGVWQQCQSQRSDTERTAS
jgi:outer membrane receptor protein involved in Fe transport